MGDSLDLHSMRSPVPGGIGAREVENGGFPLAQLSRKNGLDSRGPSLLRRLSLPDDLHSIGLLRVAVRRCIGPSNLHSSTLVSPSTTSTPILLGFVCASVLRTGAVCCRGVTIGMCVEVIIRS